MPYMSLFKIKAIALEVFKKELYGPAVFVLFQKVTGAILIGHYNNKLACGC